MCLISAYSKNGDIDQQSKIMITMFSIMSELERDLNSQTVNSGSGMILYFIHSLLSVCM